MRRLEAWYWTVRHELWEMRDALFAAWVLRQMRAGRPAVLYVHRFGESPAEVVLVDVETFGSLVESAPQMAEPVFIAHDHVEGRGW